MSTQKLVIIFSNKLSRENFYKLENELLHKINKINITIHGIRGFGNTKVLQNENIIYGWTDYIYFETELANINKLKDIVSSIKHLTAFNIQNLNEEDYKKVDLNSILNINKLQRQFTNKFDYFNLIYNC